MFVAPHNRAYPSRCYPYAQKLTSASLSYTAFSIFPAPDSDKGSFKGSFKGNGGPTRPNTPSRLQDQETGKIGVKETDSEGRPYFGPARGGNYDPSQWALTVPASTVVEVLQDPDPPNRKRHEGRLQPVHMKPLSKRNDPLPSLITILGAIPGARETLLFRRLLLDNYGSHQDWWSGTKIDSARVRHDGEDPSFDAQWDLIHETQRLMAFTKESERSYGSVEPLSSLSALTNIDNEVLNVKFESQADRFLYAWSNAPEIAKYDDAFWAFLSTCSKHHANADNPFQTQNFWMFNLRAQSQPNLRHTLYDAVDKLVYPDTEGDKNGIRACLSQIAPILVFTVRNDESASSQGLNMDVPPSIYLDRYLEEHIDAAKAMRENSRDCREAVENIEKRLKKLQTHRLDANKNEAISSKDLFSTAIKFLNPHRENESSEHGDEQANEPSEPHCKKLADQLAVLYSRLEKKVKSKCFNSWAPIDDLTMPISNIR
jgi:hypothetical protein